MQAYGSGNKKNDAGVCAASSVSEVILYVVVVRPVGGTIGLQEATNNFRLWLVVAVFTWFVVGVKNLLMVSSSVDAKSGWVPVSQNE